MATHHALILTLGADCEPAGHLLVIDFLPKPDRSHLIGRAAVKGGSEEDDEG